MDEILKMLEQLVNGGGGEPHKMTEQEKKHMEEEVEKDIKDFHSLVSFEEVLAIRELNRNMEKLIDLHNQNVDRIKEGDDITAQQAAHYMTYCSCIKDAMKEICVLMGFTDDTSARAIAEARIEKGWTYDRMCATRVLNDILG